MKLTKLALAISSVALLSGCGSSSDPDSGSNSGSTLSGVAYDGYVALGSVYHDSNDNARLDSWEARALTDEEGYFSTGRDGTDYCSLPSSDTRSLYCLRTLSSGGTIRISGGIDLFTGQQFDGSLSRTFETSGTNTVISPISSLLEGLSEDQSASLLDTLGLTAEDIDLDILNTGDADVDTAKFGAIYELHKIVQVIEASLSNVDQIGEEDYPSSLSNVIYQTLAERIISGDATIGNLNTDITEIQSAIQSRVNAIYQAVNDERPSDETPISAPSINISSGVSRADDVSDMVGTIFSGPDQDLEVLKGKARAVEIVVEKIENGEAGIDAAINEGETNTDYQSALEGDAINFRGLVNNNFSAPSNLDDLADATGSDNFSDFTGNMSLYFTDNEPDINAQALLVFGEQTDDSSTREFRLCLNYDEGTTDSGDESEYNVTGELLEGTWGPIAGSNNSALMTIDFLGPQRVTVTSLGGTSYEFTLLENTGSYNSTGGIQTIDTLPETTSECETLLSEAALDSTPRQSELL